MNKYISHFKTITKHRLIVMKLCIKCGFIWRGLTHDLSKYGITEFCSSAKYFQGNRSPIDAEKEATGYSLAWQHHKGHNPHHWEYWIDNVGTRRNDPVKIPYKYVVEMICDWISASIVYSKSKCDFDKPYSEPLQYHNAHKGERIIHPQTSGLIDTFLKLISYKGVNYFCKTVRTDSWFIKDAYTNSYTTFIFEDKEVRI